MKQIMLTTFATVCVTLCCKGPVKHFSEHPSIISNSYLWHVVSQCLVFVSYSYLEAVGVKVGADCLLY